MSESDPLVDGSRRRDVDGGGGGGGGGGGASRWCNRALLLTLIVALVSVSLLFNMKMRAMTAHMASEDSMIHTLEKTVREQADVIERFADSVTNSDVLARVNGLEDRLNVTAQTLSDRLEATEDRIGNLLNATLLTLNTIVNEAQTEIHGEVDRVKEDVDEYVRTTQDQFSMENSFMVYQLAGTFTLLACLITMWHMTAHLRKFKEPYVQRKILAILWMSPIYGITSWLSLVYPMLEGYLAVVKDFYEAYVIYQFLSFLIAVLGRGDRSAVVNLLAGHADHLEPPFRLFSKCFPRHYESNHEMAEEVLLQCQAFAMQFVFCRPLTTIGIFVCNKVEFFGRGESSTDYRSPQFWFLMIQNVSVFVAFSGLLKFYHAVQDDLAWCRPFPKFLCIKGIVFMTFWQGLAIAILAKTTGQDAAPGVAQASDGDDDEDPDIWAKQAQNFLICLEMLGFSIAHFYCFPTEEWEPGYRPKVEKDTKFGDNIALRDFFSDLKLVLKGNKKRRKSKRKSAKKIDEEEGGGDGSGDGSDGETEADQSVYTETTAGGSSSVIGEGPDEPVTPQMKKAAARLMASLNFQDFDSDEFTQLRRDEFADDEVDEETREGMAGLMEKIARMSDEDSADDDGGAAAAGSGRGAGGKGAEGLNGAGGSYGALAESEAEEEDGRRRKVNFEPATEDEEEELGSPEVLVSSDHVADVQTEPKETTETSGLLSTGEEDEEMHTENDHLLRPSLWTTK